MNFVKVSSLKCSPFHLSHLICLLKLAFCADLPMREASAAHLRHYRRHLYRWDAIVALLAFDKRPIRVISSPTRIQYKMYRCWYIKTNEAGASLFHALNEPILSLFNFKRKWRNIWWRGFNCHLNFTATHLYQLICQSFLSLKHTFPLCTFPLNS